MVDGLSRGDLDHVGASLDALLVRLAEHPLPAAAATATAAATASGDATSDYQRYSGWLSPLSNTLERVLGFLQSGLETLHVPYSYGFSIVLLTLLVRTATFPLTKKQIEVAMAGQKLKPTIDRIKARYGDDKERVQAETARLYEMTKINPLAGCLPSLASIPIFLGLYYSLGNVASGGKLDQEGFFWIPSLAGPTSLAARRAGSGAAWLLPLDSDGAPPIGWDAAAPYLVLPVLLVAMQYLSSALIAEDKPKDDDVAKKDDPSNNAALQALTKVLPLMLGWFSLNVPAGLSLYYFTNITVASAQQIYLRKLGGAKLEGFDLPPEEKYGVGLRSANPTTQGDAGEGAGGLASAPATAVVVQPEATQAQQTLSFAEEGLDLGLGGGIGEAVGGESEEATCPETDAAAAVAVAAGPAIDLSKRCKRRRLVPAPGSAAANS